MKDTEELAEVITSAIWQHLFACEPVVHKRVTHEEVEVIARKTVANIQRLSARRVKVIAFPQPVYASYRNEAKRRKAAKAAVQAI